MPGPSTRPTCVTVVLCSYNGAEFITQQLRSIVAQTAPPLEIIVSDDGSTDDTVALARAVAATSPVPIRIVENKRQLGYADNFLQACERSAGRVIAFSDQDDIWHPSKLATQLARMHAAGAVLCAHAVQPMDQRGHHLPDRRRRWADRTRITPRLNASPWGNFKGFTVLFDRSLLELLPADRRGLDTHDLGTVMPHDRWLYFLATSFGTTVFLADRLASYRQHDSQLYGSTEHRPVRSRVATKLREGEAQARYLAEVASHRAELLAEHRPDGAAPAWAEAEARWRAIQRNLLASARLYDWQPTGRRLRLIAGNVGRGVYGRYRFGGLGLERLVEDVVLTAALAGKDRLSLAGLADR